MRQNYVPEATFWQILSSETVRVTAEVTINQPLIGGDICPFDWWQILWPKMMCRLGFMFRLAICSLVHFYSNFGFITVMYRLGLSSLFLLAISVLYRAYIRWQWRHLLYYSLWSVMSIPCCRSTSRKRH